VYKCWICDARGRNVRRLIRRFGDFQSLQEWDLISGKVNLDEFEHLFRDDPLEEMPQVVELPPEFKSLTSSSLPLTSRFAKTYLKSRHVTQSDILKWKIGYAASGEYSGRIIIPSFDMSGALNYFIARAYDKQWRKYMNPAASRDLCFNELFVDWDSDLILVEGVFDAIVAGNAVPILGSSLRKNSKLIRRIVENDTPVYVALDADAEKKATKIIQTMLQYDIELYKIDVTGHEDVGSMTREEFQNRKAVASFVDADSQLMQSVMSI
jgi:DNA primase